MRRRKLANPDLVVAQIASRQHGVIGLAQLYWAGLSPTGVRRRTQAGRLHRIHRGVYAVGIPKLSREGTWFAAVAACGPDAVLSHQSAGALWQLSPPTSAVVHVTVATSAGRAKREGIVIHRSTTLTKRDTTRRHNIPVTTLARTHRDLGFGPERTRSGLE
ncbi:MAG: type IV toxin-antitoxin system AbiEi family antitoxin domain-containing protein, partial [Solirubrobacterales bacterium]